jgi:hypothetical protein
MREIKFRAWDKKYNYMIEPEDIHPRVMNECITGDGRVLEINETNSYMGTDISYEDISDTRILMQYTGFEGIYEGDILYGEEIGDFGMILSRWYGLVYWDEEKCGFYVKDDLEDIYRLDDFDYSNIAGNVYENPDLISK